MTTSDPARIGAIDFLNARPLVDGLESHVTAPAVTWGLPSKLARELFDGELDLALVPQVEAIRDPDYRIVPGPCVSCRGEVESILVFGETDWGRVQRVGADRASRSSAELLRVLFHLQERRVPQFIEVGSNLDALDAGSVDAILLIGDPALANRHDPRPRVDLGQRWWELVGLPFVFAVWLGRSDTTNRAVECVRDVWQMNRDRREEFAREFAMRHPDVVNERESVRYLTRSIRYDLGPEEVEAIEVFSRLRGEIGSAVPDGWTPRFFDGEPSAAYTRESATDSSATHSRASRPGDRA